MPKFDPGILNDINAYRIQAITWINNNEYLFDTSAFRVQRQALLKVKNVFGLASADVPLLADSRCKIGSECDVRPSIQYLKDIRYFRTAFGSLIPDGSISSGELDNTQATKVKATLEGWSNWLTSIVGGYLSGNVKAFKIGTNEPCSYFDLFETGTFTATCLLEPPKQVINDANNLSETADTLASNFISAPDTKALSPISVDNVGSQQLLDLLDKLYQAQNNNAYIIIRRSTEASTNTSSIIQLINDLDSDLSYLRDNTNATRTELKEARTDAKLIRSRIEEIHTLENNALYEIRIRSEEAVDFLRFIRDDTQITKDDVRQLFDFINTNFDTLYNFIQRENAVLLGEFREVYSRLDAIEDRILNQLYEIKSRLS